jgi:hypothetical protein
LSDLDGLIVLQCPLRYRLTVAPRDDGPGTGFTQGEGEAEGRLLKETLEVWPVLGEPLSVSYREIIEIQEGDYRFKVILGDGQMLELSEMGYRYEDFLENLIRLRNELRLSDMLMDESVIVPRIAGRFREVDQAQGYSGDCSVRLYERALVIIPRVSDPVRIPLTFISQVSEIDYALRVDTQFGQSYVFSQMGEGLDLLKRSLSKALNDMRSRAMSICRDILPNAPAKTLWALAKHMEEGKAARKRDISAISTTFWSQMEKRLASSDIWDSYEHLKSLSIDHEMCIGFKRGLMPRREEDDYLWFLAPIAGDGTRGGNALAMEATLSLGSGRATYFFRIMSRGEFRVADNERLLDEVRRAIEIVSRSMIDINFRREPIYLPYDRLLEPRYARYLSALDLLPSLRVLRNLFIGRVPHVTPEQWKKDVEALLAFNVRVAGDDEKWQRTKGGHVEDYDEVLE